MFYLPPMTSSIHERWLAFMLTRFQAEPDLAERFLRADPKDARDLVRFLRGERLLLPDEALSDEEHDVVLRGAAPAALYQPLISRLKAMLHLPA